jgi:hypothetical protein
VKNTERNEKINRMTAQIICGVCGTRKPIEQFQYLYHGDYEGLGQCKKCRRLYDSGKVSWAAYKKMMRKVDNAKWRKENPHKMKAHSEIAKALRKGKLTKPKECEMCGRKVYLYAHHWDYKNHSL